MATAVATAMATAVSGYSGGGDGGVAAVSTPQQQYGDDNGGSGENPNSDTGDGVYGIISWLPQYHGGEWNGGAETGRVAQPNHSQERGEHPVDAAEVYGGTRDHTLQGGGLFVLRFPEPHVLKVGFSRIIPGSEVVLGLNASSVHCTGNARGVIKKRFSRPWEVYLVISDGSRVKVAYLG